MDSGKKAMSPKRKAVKSPIRVSMSKVKAYSPSRKLLSKKKPARGRTVKREEKEDSSRSSSCSSSSSSSSSSSDGSYDKYKLPKGAYPPAFDICGYAEEVYDANKSSPAFEKNDFHKAMAMYSFVFSYEKELKNTKDMLFAAASYDGVKCALTCLFDNTEKLLKKTKAKQQEKNETIREIHMKNILGMLKK